MTWRAPWWMYVVAAVYALTFLFNTRQEFLGPASEGWVLSGAFVASSVQPGGPMDQAGLRPGDVLETVGGLPLTGAPNWFLARAHFERGRPVELQIRRGEQHLALKLVIFAPVWRAWNERDCLPAVALYIARFVLLMLAILVGFSRPRQLSARLLALMFAVAAVAEGYPCSGWAAALRHLPALLAVPIGLATASCLFAAVVWLAFFASFLRHRLSRQLRWVLLVVPTVLFGPSITASVVAIIYTPFALARPWPVILSVAPVHFIQDFAGVTPLLFLNKLPLYQPMVQAKFLEMWLVVTMFYFAAGGLMLVANYRQLEDQQARRRVRTLLIALPVFAVVIAHNFFARNWTSWFGSRPPELFSGVGFVGEALLFLVIPLSLAYCVLTEGDRFDGLPSQDGGSKASG
jgi:hypothetical protein